MDAEEIKKNMQDGINALRKELETSTDERVRVLCGEQIKELTEKIGQYEKEIETIRRTGGGFGSISVPGTEHVKFSLSKALSGHLYGWTKENGLEQEVIKAARDEYAKTMNATIDTAGALLLPVQVGSSIIESLEAQSVVFQAGATRLPATGRSASYVTENGGITAYWIGENEVITESELKFGEKTVNPRKLAALVPISGSLLRQGGAEVDALIARKMTLRLDQALDIELLTGNKPDRPRGVVYTAGSTYALGDNGGRLRFDDLAKIDDVLAGKDVPLDNIAQITRREVITGIRTERVPTFSGGTKETGSMPVFPMATEASMAAAIGKYFTSSKLSKTLTKGTASNCTYFIRGDWSTLNVLTWGGLLLAKSEHVKFTSDIVLMRAIMECNSFLEQPERLCVVSDAKVAD